MYHVSTQGVDERMINVHYYYTEQKREEEKKSVTIMKTWELWYAVCDVRDTLMTSD